MREIIHRGKHLDSDDFIEGHLLWYEDGRARIVERHTDIYALENNYNIIQVAALPVIPETVGQYTGLKDVNDKKIFEGDILSECPQGNSVAYLGVVAYDEKLAAFVYVIGRERKVTLGSYSCSYKVVGNIYDNAKMIGG